jgi:two-component system cell cycle sensor histidine kinase/response regulator CckA
MFSAAAAINIPHMPGTPPADEQRHAADLQLRSVIENAPLVVWSIDRDGIFTLSEGRGLAHLGLTPGQVVGQSAFAIYKDFPELLASLRRALAGEEVLATLHVVGRVFETVYQPLRDAAGQIVGLLGISTDVTERHRAETEQALLQAQLLQVQKLESLGLLAGGIAHDFNNILTAVLGSASSALLSLPAGHPAAPDIQNVLTAARRAADLTRQMLAYSGKGQFEVRAVDLSRLVSELGSLLETTISKKVTLRLELADGLPAIEADVAQVQQVVMNLVINGAEAIGDQRGTVVVTTGVQDLDEATIARLPVGERVAPGRYVFVEVKDSGCGMDAPTQAKMFDPFFTTKFTGRGLGLAAVLGIMRSHRGAVKVQSTPGQGTVFNALFPASSAEIPVAGTRATRFRGKGLALVIDDDAGVRAAARRILAMLGFEAIVAADGRAGAALFAERAREIAVVLLDMTMPEMNGEETFREIRRVRDDVPVILTSGYDEIEATRRFTSKGLAGFLQKPFGSEDLTRKLAAVFGEHA